MAEDGVVRRLLRRTSRIAWRKRRSRKKFQWGQTTQGETTACFFHYLEESTVIMMRRTTTFYWPWQREQRCRLSIAAWRIERGTEPGRTCGLHRQCETFLANVWCTDLCGARNFEEMVVKQFTTQVRGRKHEQLWPRILPCSHVLLWRLLYACKRCHPEHSQVRV